MKLRLPLWCRRGGIGEEEGQRGVEREKWDFDFERRGGGWGENRKLGDKRWEEFTGGELD